MFISDRFFRGTLHPIENSRKFFIRPLNKLFGIVLLGRAAKLALTQRK